MGKGAGSSGRRILVQINVLAILLLLCLTVGTTRVSAAVYWGSSVDGVGAANLDGSEPQWNYFYWPLRSESQGPAGDVAVNSEYLYWTTYGGIARRKLADGDGIYPGTVVPHLKGSGGLAIDERHIYWTSSGPPSPFGQPAGSLSRANLDGSGATNAFVTGLESPCDVTVSGDYVFWVEHPFPTGWDGIGRANLDGSSPQRPLVPLSTLNRSCGIAASGDFLYWGQDEAIARANLDGGEVNEAFIPNTGFVDGIAIHAGRIYWNAQWGPGGTSSIGRANLDGSEADPTWITSSESWLRGIAVDARPTPPYLTLPSRRIRIVPSVEYNFRSGAALLSVYVPPSGRLAAPTPPQGQLKVVSRGLSWKVFGSTVPRPANGGAYLWQVRIRSGRGAVGRRIRTQLRRQGWAPVKVRLSYTQERVYPVEATRKLVLRRYRGAGAGWIKHPHPLKTGTRRSAP